MHLVGVWVNNSDWEKQMVTFELVHEGIEKITQADKVHSKKTGWQIYRHEPRKSHGICHDSNAKLKGREGSWNGQRK